MQVLKRRKQINLRKRREDKPTELIMHKQLEVVTQQRRPNSLMKLFKLHKKNSECMRKCLLKIPNSIRLANQISLKKL